MDTADDLDEVMGELFKRSVAARPRIPERSSLVTSETRSLGTTQTKKTDDSDEPLSYDAQTLVPPPPTVTSISPSSGSLAGGTAVTITGTKFLTGANVKIGGVACTSVVVVNATTITCTDGAHAAGVVDVVVENAPGGDPIFSGTLTNGFTYLADPVISRVTGHYGIPISDPVDGNNPLYEFAWGDAAGGDTIHVYGSNFVNGATVTFGGVSATGIVFVSSSELRMTNPAHADGRVDVVVTNPSGQSVTRSNGFKYQHDPNHSIQPTGLNPITSGGPLNTYVDYLLESPNVDAYRADYQGHLEHVLTLVNVSNANFFELGSHQGSFPPGGAACYNNIYEHSGGETFARYRLSADLTPGATDGDIYIDYFDYYYHHRYGTARIYTDHIHVNHI